MPTSTGSAPGRLDVMGGVADYAGALVLEMATSLITTVVAEPADALVIGPINLTADDLGHLARMDYPKMRAELSDVPKWSLYPLGVVLVLVRHGIIEPPMVELHITSEVPQSIGVSSSAALEVATARSLVGDRIDGVRMGFLCQDAENSVVGAPCGVMDQITAAVGLAGHVVPILCRPGRPGPLEKLPDQLEVVGWPTGTEFDVTGLPYRRARTAAFMGKRLVERTAGRSWDWISEMPADRVSALPEALTGGSLLDQFDGTNDQMTIVDPHTDYPVRAATAFGRAEHHRSEEFLLAVPAADQDRTRSLFAASHAGYQAIGLGHPTADRVVAEVLVRPDVYGARSSGGGSGGTVVVLCRRGTLDDIDCLIRSAQCFPVSR